MDDAALDKLTRLHGFHTRDELFVAIGNKRVVLGDADKNVFKEKQNSNWKKSSSTSPSVTRTTRMPKNNRKRKHRKRKSTPSRF